eukprot:COSAG02_NODE_41466_length_394_cov_1.030508_1_plen_49_part_01
MTRACWCWCYCWCCLRLRRAAKKIAVVPGDGIGPEVMDEAIKVLEAGAD